MVDEVTSLKREDVIQAKLSTLPQTTLEEAMVLVLERLDRELDKAGLEDLNVSYLQGSILTLREFVYLNKGRISLRGL